MAKPPPSPETTRCQYVIGNVNFWPPVGRLAQNTREAAVWAGFEEPQAAAAMSKPPPEAGLPPPMPGSERDYVRNAMLYHRYKYLTLPGFRGHALEDAARCAHVPVDKVAAQLVAKGGPEDDNAILLSRDAKTLWVLYDTETKERLRDEWGEWRTSAPE